MPYTQLRVTKEITVLAGPAAAVPDLAASGGAMQYLFDESIGSLIGEFLEKIP